MTGLSVIDLRIWSAASTGEVFNLSSVSDFSGNYAAGGAGVAVAGGQSYGTMKNEHGVVLRLHGTQQGVRLALAPQRVAFRLKY